jgi:hypothetical protein
MQKYNKFFNLQEMVVFYSGRLLRRGVYPAESGTPRNDNVIV